MIIADACNNHLGDTRLILRMIELCPADYIKFQLYDPKELSDDWADDYEYYKACALSDDDILLILGACNRKRIKPMFTVFSMSQIERAERYGLSYLKIASPNATNIEFVRHAHLVADSFLTISTGMNTNKERISLAREFPRAVILYCISRYPAVWTESEREYALNWDGISDHSNDIDTAIWAVRNNLCVERHYTLGKDLPGKDHHISSTPDEFKKIVDERNYLNKVERYKTRWG